MNNGYPAEASINTYFSERGFEIPDEYATPYYTQFKQFAWAILNMMDWAGTLAVYCPSATTFNVRGGDYVYKGTVKTYSPGAAIDPADNDTTYIWLKNDNTIGYGIDGDGWPQYEHVKLAEIDVDTDGVITAIRDLRGRNLWRVPVNAISLLASGVAGMQAADGKTTIYTVPSGKKAVVTHVVVRQPTASLAGGTDYDFGDGANADTWKTAVDLADMTGTDDYRVITNDNATVAAVFDAGDEFGVKPVTGATADADATIDVFGYEFDA